MKLNKKEKIEEVRLYIGNLSSAHESPIVFLQLDTESHNYVGRVSVGTFLDAPKRIKSMIANYESLKDIPIRLFSLQTKETIPPISPMDSTFMKGLETKLKEGQGLNVEDHPYQIFESIPEGKRLFEYHDSYPTKSQPQPQPPSQKEQAMALLATPQFNPGIRLK